MRLKHPPKIHIWGGISARGATNVVMFSGIMNATRYTDILSAGLVPFLEEVYPDSHRFQQDNDPNIPVVTPRDTMRRRRLTGGRRLLQVRI